MSQVEVKRLEEKLEEQKRAERSALDELVLKSNEVRSGGGCVGTAAESWSDVVGEAKTDFHPVQKAATSASRIVLTRYPLCIWTTIRRKRKTERVAI